MPRSLTAMQWRVLALARDGILLIGVEARTARTSDNQPAILPLCALLALVGDGLLRFSDRRRLDLTDAGRVVLEAAGLDG